MLQPDENFIPHHARTICTDKCLPCTPHNDGMERRALSFLRFFRVELKYSAAKTNSLLSIDNIQHSFNATQQRRHNTPH